MLDAPRPVPAPVHGDPARLEPSDLLERDGGAGGRGPLPDTTDEMEPEGYGFGV